MSVQLRRAKGSFGGKPIVDSPLNHGWKVVRRSDVDGAYIYGLNGAECRRSFDDPWHVWIGNVNGHSFTFDTRQGDLAEMTRNVKNDRGDFMDFVDGPLPIGENEMDKFENHGWTKVSGEASWTLDDNHGHPSVIITSANKYMWTCCILGQTFRYPKTAPLSKITRQVMEAIDAINNRRPNVTTPDNYGLEARY